MTTTSRKVVAGAPAQELRDDPELLEAVLDPAASTFSEGDTLGAGESQLVGLALKLVEGLEDRKSVV